MGLATMMSLCVQTLIAPRPYVAPSPNFAYPQNLCTGICRYLARNSATLPSGGKALRHASNGVKCNFCSPHHHVRKIVGKFSIRRVWMWNFAMIRPKTKKLWLSIVPVRRPSEQPGLGPPLKGVNCTFLGQNLTRRTALESYPSRTLKYAVSAGLAKR